MTRSRLGCVQCKKRKVKCDELKPTCSRCKKRNILCNYSLKILFQKKIPIKPKESEKLYMVPSHIPPSKVPLLPLPNNLLLHPYFKDVINFYIHFTAHYVVASKPQIYPENAFANLLPAHAKKNPALFDAMASYAISHRSSVLTDENYSQEIVDALLFRAFKDITDKDTKMSHEAIALTALTICVQKLFSRNEIEEYNMIINIAYESFQSLLDLSKSLNNKNYYIISEKEHPDLYFIMTWIAYHEVLAIISSISPSTFCVPQRPKLLFENIKIIKHFKIDKFLGFNANFLPFFDKLIPMLRKVEASTEGVIAIDIIAEARIWEIEFTATYNNTYSQSLLLDETASDTILQNSNTIFFHAGLLHLYRRIYHIPRSSETIQEHVKKIKWVYENIIESASAAENCSIFALFIAACEAINENDRTFFYERFKIQFLGGNLPAGDVLKILDYCWQHNSTWIDAIKNVGLVSGFYLI